MLVAQLSLQLIWNLHSYLNSFSLIANPSLLPLSDIALKIRSSSDLKCSSRCEKGEKKRLVADYSVTINHFTLLDVYPLSKIEDLVNQIDKYFSSIDLRLAYDQVPLLAEE